MRIAETMQKTESFLGSALYGRKQHYIGFKFWTAVFDTEFLTFGNGEFQLCSIWYSILKFQKTFNEVNNIENLDRICFHLFWVLEKKNHQQNIWMPDSFLVLNTSIFLHFRPCICIMQKSLWQYFISILFSSIWFDLMTNYENRIK